MADVKPTSPLQAIGQYFRDFAVLRDNPREFWAIQAVNFLDSAAYFSFMNVAVLYLSQTIGLEDVPAGYVYTAFTMLVTISLFIAGFVTDALGVRRTVLLAMGLLLASRGGIAIVGFLPDIPHRAWLVVPLFLLGSPGMAMTQTLYQAANRRFSTARSRGASFNIWYLMMNLGALAAGYLIDGVHLGLGLENWSWIIAVGAGTTLVSLFVGFTLIRREAQAGAAANAAPPQTSVPALQRVKALVVQEAFWKFMVLMVSVLGVRAVFVYFSMLMPKYWQRVIGPDVQMGLLQTINPWIVMVGVVLMVPIANRFHIFWQLVVGATISALSLLVLVSPWGWFGDDPASGYFRMAVGMAVILSVGELLWSPKLSEYTAAIAPPGQEGAYYGLSMVPWFGAKLAVSAMSGHMLVRWCPEGVGERIAAGDLPFWQSPEAMWFILFLWALAGPLLAVFLSRWLTRGADLDPRRAEAA